MSARIALMALLLSAQASLSFAGQPTLGTQAEREEGRRLYDRYCSQCHGEKGDGKGPASAFLIPPARDFTTGKYKVRTTPNGELPTDDDLRRIIRDGMPYTAMPPWPELSDKEIDALVYYLKTFTPDFADPVYLVDPMKIVEPAPPDEKTILTGKEIYKKADCGRCHGPLGRGGGKSAPTLKDDNGLAIQPADLTQPWKFRGGHSRSDVFRTISAAFNGTPMPDFAKSLPEEERWALSDYVLSLSESDQPNYGTLLEAIKIDKSFGLDRLEEMFQAATPTRFALLGQIIEPGRSFAWPIISLEARAIYNNEEIAFLIEWNDMSAERTTANDPTLEVPPYLEELPQPPQPETEEGDGGEEDFWGDAEAEEAPADEGDFWGDDLAEEEDEAEDEAFWGEELAGDESDSEDGFWDEEDPTESAAGAEGAGPKFVEAFSDAVALQFPTQPGDGPKSPYFLFGDKSSSVDLWYRDLAKSKTVRYLGRGSDALVLQEGEPIETRVEYRQGRWTAIFKRRLRAPEEVGFSEGAFVPIAFSVWDGFSRERGNRRGLTGWHHLYLKPPETQTPLEASLKAAFLVLLAEIFAIAILRRKYRRIESGTNAHVEE